MRSWAFLASVLATSLAWTIYAFTLMMVVTNPPWARAAVGAGAGLLFGSFAAAGQYALLVERIARPTKWVVLTLLGWSCAGILVGLVRPTMDLGVDYILGMTLGGLAVGLLQWLALTGLSARFHVFVPATTAAWALAGFVSWKLYEWLYLSDLLTAPALTLLSDARDPGFEKEITSGLIGASISGLMLGLLTSAVLVFTARARRSSPVV